MPRRKNTVNVKILALVDTLDLLLSLKEADLPEGETDLFPGLVGLPVYKSADYQSQIKQLNLAMKSLADTMGKQPISFGKSERDHDREAGGLYVLHVSIPEPPHEYLDILRTFLETHKTKHGIPEGFIDYRHTPQMPVDLLIACLAEVRENSAPEDTSATLETPINNGLHAAALSKLLNAAKASAYGDTHEILFKPAYTGVEVTSSGIGLHEAIDKLTSNLKQPERKKAFANHIQQPDFARAAQSVYAAYVAPIARSHGYV